MAWVGDLASRSACDDLLAAAQSTVGQVTHFVHSAAPQRQETDHALAVTTETWERMHAVNVDASFHTATWQAAALATNCWLPHTQPSGESRTSYTARPLNGTKPTTRSQ